MNKSKFVRIPIKLHKEVKRLAKKDNRNNLFKHDITIQDETAILLSEAINNRKRD